MEAQANARPTQTLAQAGTRKLVQGDFPQDIDEPAFQRRTPSYGTSQVAITAAASLVKREPVQGSPWTSGDNALIDRPAYTRK